MKNTWMQVAPPAWCAAITSASPISIALTTSVPCTCVSPRMRSRSLAACSKARSAAAASISAASSFCTVPEWPERKRFACVTSAAYSASETRPTQGAAQRLSWKSRQGRVRLSNIASVQERSRKARCGAGIAWFTAQAEA